MVFVLDASVVASWAFADEVEPVALAAYERLRTEEASAPAHWWFEVRNALIVNERRGRIRETETKTVLMGLAILSVTIDRTPDESGIFHFARKHRLTFYDAAYLELASRLNAPLATLDKKLAAAAVAEKLSLLQAP